MPHPLDSVCLGHYRRRGRARGALVLRDPVEGLHAPLNDLVHPRPIGQVLLQAKPAQVNNRGVVANTFFIFYFFFREREFRGQISEEWGEREGGRMDRLVSPLSGHWIFPEITASARLPPAWLKTYSNGLSPKHM